jgi:hypothetical protein
LIALDTAPEFLLPNVFDGDENEGWLYLCYDAQKTPFNRKRIITHFAHQRLRMEVGTISADRKNILLHLPFTFFVAFPLGLEKGA